MLIIDVFLCKRKLAHSFNDTHNERSGLYAIILLYGLLFA